MDVVRFPVIRDDSSAEGDTGRLSRFVPLMVTASPPFVAPLDYNVGDERRIRDQIALNTGNAVGDY